MNFLDDYKREAGLQPATSLSRRGAEPSASPDPNVPTAEEELLSGEERQAAIYARLMAEMEADCDGGDGVACEELSKEEKAKAAWIASANAAEGQAQRAAPPSAPVAAAPSAAVAPGTPARDPNLPTAEEEESKRVAAEASARRYKAEVAKLQARAEAVPAPRLSSPTPPT